MLPVFNLPLSELLSLMSAARLCGLTSAGRGITHLHRCAHSTPASALRAGNGCGGRVGSHLPPVALGPSQVCGEGF